MPKFNSPINLLNNELQNAKLQNLASAPGSASSGLFYYNTATNTPYHWNGTTWIPWDATKLPPASLPIALLTTNPLDRGNHTGTQLAATISNFDTQVRTSRLDQLAPPTAAVNLNGQKITGAIDPVNASDYVTKQYSDASVQNAIAGLDQKPSVRVLATSNISLSGLQTIDGVSLAATDRVLVVGQTNGTQNGFYSAATGLWTRTTDADANSEITPGAFTFIEEGTTYGKTQWRCTNTGNIVLGTTNIVFEQFGAAQTYQNGNGLDLTGNTFSVRTPTNSGVIVDSTGVKIDPNLVARKVIATIGDGSSSSYTITHNLNTQDIATSLREISTNAIVFADIVAATANTVIVSFASVVPSNSYRLSIIG